MTLIETINTHLQILPPALQRETLDFITWIESRYNIAAPTVALPSNTEIFIAKHAGVLSQDFPNDIDTTGLGLDIPRANIE